MATRLNKYGQLESYDPLDVFKPPRKVTPPSKPEKPPKKKQEVELPKLEKAPAPSRQGTRKDALELAQARARAAGIPETSSEFPFFDPEKRGGIITTREEMEAEVKRGAEEVAVGIPEAKELEETAVGAFGEIEIAPETSLLQLTAGTPLGQAITGKVALDELKRQGKADLILEMTNHMLKNGLTPEQVSNDPGTQMLLSLELDEKDIELLKSGEAEVTALAQLMEGLPAKAFGVGKYITTIPSERIDALQMKIEKMGNQIRDYRMAAARTPANKDIYLELIEKNEMAIRDAESRIKLLVIQSPKYQNAPEEVEVIFVTIDRSLTRIGDARNAVLMGETLEEAMASQLNN